MALFVRFNIVRDAQSGSLGAQSGGRNVAVSDNAIRESTPVKNKLPYPILGANPECGNQLLLLKEKILNSKRGALAMDEVLRRFDRQTGWLLAGLLGGLILTAMAIGVQLQKHWREEVNLPVKTMEVGVHHPVIFQPQETATAATPDLNSDADRRNVQASPSILATQRTPVQVKGSKASIAKSKPSKQPRIVDAKRRLVELWHQSLARAERRSWTLFQTNKRVKEKVSYTAETNH